MVGGIITLLLVAAAILALTKRIKLPFTVALVLVEGESLFNDATSIVLSRILVEVVAVGYFTVESAIAGALDFFVVFIGGVLVGWVLAVAFGWLLGRVDSDPQIEISLTTVLAYLSFLLAEEVFHVSGRDGHGSGGDHHGQLGTGQVFALGGQLCGPFLGIYGLCGQRSHLSPGRIARRS